MEININDLTIGQLKEITNLVSCGKNESKSNYPIGKNVIVRTVTMIYTGKLVSVTDTDFILNECSWYMDFVENGTVNECEPYPSDLNVYINRGSLLDMCELKKSLPRSQK